MRETSDTEAGASGPSPGPFARDVRRAPLAAGFGCAAAAAADYVATLVSAGTQLSIGAVLRLFLLELSLAALWFPVAIVVVAAVAGGVHLLVRLRPAAAPGFDGVLRAPATAGRAGRAASWMWSGAAAAGIYIATSAYLTLLFHTHFNAPALVAVALGGIQLALVAACAACAAVLARALARLGGALDRPLGRANPLGHAGPAAVALAALASTVALAVGHAVPAVGNLLPWRHLLVLAAFAGGVRLSATVLARRGGLLRARGRRRRRVLAATAAGATVVVTATLVHFGAEPGTKYLAVTSSPPMASSVRLLRAANDFDRDGYGSLLGENDCAPLDHGVHPGARDVPGNGRDENCNGRDFSFAQVPRGSGGSDLPVPDHFRRDDYNILLITVDTLRYDHTGFGGYEDRTGRDTTPQLDDYVDRSVSFSFANAPSAGTMASIPAILTSKFFHSGIALDHDVEPGSPPRLRPQNTLISEVMKRAGYSTGAILTHYYFRDWGMEQGFDTYDNELGNTKDPKTITSDAVTDKALAWISQQSGRKWFLWAHYLDPHGHYVSHPDTVSFGDSEKDRYDGEIRYTDKHLGRLFEELRKMPDGDRTIVMITSDHGDGFNEHGFINHGMALYRELLHVPLIIHVPELTPRVVPGPVSPLDLFPTAADIAQIDVSDLHFEGKSLIPQLFYGEDARDRTAFAETNWPEPLRAVITDDHKLVYNLKNNLYELYDLREDPWEKKKVQKEQPEAFRRLKDRLDRWLERVYYARDFRSNQAMHKLRDILLREAPDLDNKVDEVTFDDGTIRILGFETRKPRYRPGEKIPIAVYFAANSRPSTDFRFQVRGWADNGAGRHTRSKLRVTAGGRFPSSRWREGEYVRDRFAIRVPRSFEGDEITIGLRVADRKRRRVTVDGPTREARDDIVILGTIPVAGEPIPKPDGAKGR